MPTLNRIDEPDGPARADKPFTAASQPDRLLSRKETALEYGLSENLLEKLAVRGGGPVMTKISARMVRYRRSDIESWLASKRIENTAQFKTK